MRVVLKLDSQESKVDQKWLIKRSKLSFRDFVDAFAEFDTDFEYIKESLEVREGMSEMEKKHKTEIKDMDSDHDTGEAMFDTLNQIPQIQYPYVAYTLLDEFSIFLKHSQSKALVLRYLKSNNDSSGMKIQFLKTFNTVSFEAQNNDKGASFMVVFSHQAKLIWFNKSEDLSVDYQVRNFQHTF